MCKPELGKNGVENGVEVTYTGKSIYHLTDDDGHYDAKISGRSDGSYDFYTTDDNWDSHSHQVVDANGNIIHDRPADKDSKNHPWETRDDD